MHVYLVRLAEWSKAPDLSSGTRKRAWVRTPHLTIASKVFEKVGLHCLLLIVHIEPDSTIGSSGAIG